MVDFTKHLRKENDMSKNPPPKAEATKRKSVLKVKGEQLPQKKLEQPGDMTSGLFVGYKVISLDDMDSANGKKDVRYYEFAEEGNSDKRFVVSGKLMLDQAFDTAARKLGGVDRMKDKIVQFTRLEDTRLDARRSLGNYEIEVFEA
jgi:hypothetical protein